MTYNWAKLVASLKPFAEKAVGSVRIDVEDIRIIMAQEQLRKDAIAALEACHEHFIQVDDLDEDDYPAAKAMATIERLSDA